MRATALEGRTAQLQELLATQKRVLQRTLEQLDAERAARAATQPPDAPVAAAAPRREEPLPAAARVAAPLRPAAEQPDQLTAAAAAPRPREHSAPARPSPQQQAAQGSAPLRRPAEQRPRSPRGDEETPLRSRAGAPAAAAPVFSRPRCEWLGADDAIALALSQPLRFPPPAPDELQRFPFFPRGPLLAR